LQRRDGWWLQRFDAVCEAVDEADDGVNALGINLSDVSLAE
jgi:hypothetical protein